jgi:hypothetical protein
MTDEQKIIIRLTELLQAQTKMHEAAVDMLKPATEAAYQKGYNDAMGWKTQNHLEHLPTNKEWVGLTDEEILEEYRQSYGDDGNLTDIYFARAIEAKLKEKNA